jgi:hypothetical protein
MIIHNLKEIEDFVREKFQDLPVESHRAANILFLRIVGIDAKSLANYIFQEIEGVETEIKERNYKVFSEEPRWVEVVMVNENKYEIVES